MNRYCLIVILLNYHLVSQSLSLLQRNLKGNLFHKINDDVQNTVNKVFELLKLNKNFTSLHKHRLLLSMHASMKNIAENNYPRYKDVRRASKLLVKKKIKNVLFNLDKLINILVQEKLTPGNTTLFSYHNNETGINLQLTSLEVPENKEESFAFLKEYLDNIDGGYNLDSPLQKIKKEFERNSQRVKDRRKLKTWKGTNLTVEEMNAKNSRRVFQGKNAKIKRFPFLASIHIRDEFVCAGSIINKLMIITAATCLQRVVYEDNKDIITVRVGSDHTNKSGKLCKVSQIFFHPHYNPETLSSNLAILKIEEELKFKHKTKIRRVDYQRLEGNLHSSIQEILIVGWGDINSEYSNGIGQLSYTYLDVYNFQKCTETYTSKYVNEKNFCAGFTSIGAGACQRDIGAPGIVGNVLVGVVSFGPPECGTVNAPTVFTNLGYYIDWIDSVIKEMPLNNSTKSLLMTLPSLMRAHELPTKKVTKLVSSIISINDQKQTTPSIKTTISQYPKAIKVLTYLLNQLLATDQNVDEDSEQNNDEVKNALRSDQNSNSAVMQTQMSKIDNEGNSEPILPSFDQTPKNNNDQIFNNLVMNMVIKNIGGYLGLNNILKFSEVYKSVPDTNTEEKFEDTNNNYTPYRSNVETEKVTQYASVSDTNKTNEQLYYKKAIQRIGVTKSKIGKNLNIPTIEEEYNNTAGIIFENKNDDSITDLEITTQAVIFENTNDPDEFKVPDKSEDFDPNISDNYETGNNDGISIEMFTQSYLSTLKQYKFRTTKGYTGPEYKKDYGFEFVTEKSVQKLYANRNFKEIYSKMFLKSTHSIKHFKKIGFEPIFTISTSSKSNEVTRQFPIASKSMLRERDERNFRQLNEKIRDSDNKSNAEDSSEKDSEENFSPPTSPETTLQGVTTGHTHSIRVKSTMLNGYNLEIGESDLENGRRFLDYININ